MANFARFFDVLLPGAERVVYLDADAIVNVAAPLRPAEAVVAGVPRAQAACYDAKDQRPGMFFCDKRRFKNAADPSSLKTLNAGIVLLILKRWPLNSATNSSK